jgi:hypothetical protein
MQLAVATLSRFEVVPIDGEVVSASNIEYEDSTVRYVCRLYMHAINIADLIFLGDLATCGASSSLAKHTNPT